MLGLGGGREVIGLQVAPAGTEDPKEKPDVCHLTGGGPSVGVSGLSILFVCQYPDYAHFTL